MEMTISDEEKDHHTIVGVPNRTLIMERDTNGSPIWVDRLDLMCYKVSAKGTPKGSYSCHTYNVLRTEVTCKLLNKQGVCRVAPGEHHNHRAPLPCEIRYLSARYYARVFCVTNEGAVGGLTNFLVGMKDTYNLPWAKEWLYDSMEEIARTCARTTRPWPKAPVWPESVNQVKHDERLARIQARVNVLPQAVPENRPEPAGNGAPVPEPAVGVNEGVPPVENVAGAPVPGEVFDFEAWVGAEMPVQEPLDIYDAPTVDVHEALTESENEEGPEEIPGLLPLLEIEAIMVDLDEQ